MIQYADWDSDGYPDHVLGPDGIWHEFNPQTGEMLGGTLLSAAPSGGNIPAYGQVPDSSRGGTQEPLAAPQIPRNFGTSTPPTPTYATGARHPFFGGDPLVPGGRFAAQSAGYDNRQQVHVPGGAAAGPFETRSAYAPDVPQRGGSSSSGGGSSLAKKLYYQFRDKIEGKLTGATSGSTYGSGYSSSNYKPYEPETPRMRGFARKFDPEQAMGLYYRPSMMIPRVSALKGDDPLYEEIASLPMAQLALLAGGRNLSAPKRDEYGNLTAQDRSLSDYTNQLAKSYGDVINKEKWFDEAQMARNLVTAPKRSALGAQFAKMPVGDQANAFLGSTAALFGATLDPSVAASQQQYASSLADKFGAKFLNRSPKHTPSLAKWAGKRLLYA